MFFLFLFLSLLSLPIFGEEEAKQKETPPQKEEKPSKKGPEPFSIGNFSLPTSQQPAPLVSFGQLVVGADVLQYYLLGDAFWGSKTYRTDLTGAILYGITDQFVGYFLLPVSPGNRVFDHYSSGIEDISLQFEYAYYTRTTHCYSNQATIVSAISYPSGDPDKIPPTGFGAPSFFIGGTFSHTAICWYGFFSTGALFPTDNNGTKFGDDYFYQFGYERLIKSLKDRMIFAWMIELDGTYSKKNRFHSIIDPNSGGHVILITPSLWFSTKRWIIQGGISFYALQHLNGDQPKDSAALFFILGLTI